MPDDKYVFSSGDLKTLAEEAAYTKNSLEGKVGYAKDHPEAFHADVAADGTFKDVNGEMRNEADVLQQQMLREMKNSSDYATDTARLGTTLDEYKLDAAPIAADLQKAYAADLGAKAKIKSMSVKGVGQATDCGFTLMTEDKVVVAQIPHGLDAGARSHSVTDLKTGKNETIIGIPVVEKDGTVTMAFHKSVDGGEPQLVTDKAEIAKDTAIIQKDEQTYDASIAVKAIEDKAAAATAASNADFEKNVGPASNYSVMKGIHSSETVQQKTADAVLPSKLDDHANEQKVGDFSEFKTIAPSHGMTL